MADPEAIWRDFPRDFAEFEATFPDEVACRRFLIELRWGSSPRCLRCNGSNLWQLSNGRFECADCGHQTSVTAGTPLHGTRKPLKLWFRAVWEMTTHKGGISAKDLQRIMGFGSYETAWSWLHKLRRCAFSKGRNPLEGPVQLDDGYVGGRDDRPGRPSGNKALVITAAERWGRVRMEHSPNLTKKAVTSFAERNIRRDSSVTTDGYRSFSEKSLGPRRHTRHIQPKKRHFTVDPLQQAHFALSLFKRCWIGTYHGAVSKKHLQVYLDEFEFRHNRRKTVGVGRIAARLFQSLATKSRVTYDSIVCSTRPCQRFETT
jgi:transposase-like protein